jgi:mannan endo-1,4-beta-mannosidase
MRKLFRFVAGLLTAASLSGLTVGAAQPAVAADDASVYWGAYVNGAPFNLSILDDFEAQVGKHVSIVHWGQPWLMQGAFQPFQSHLYQVVRDRGSIPMIDWGSWDLGKGTDQAAFRLSTIAGGKYDAYIAEWARAARAWGGPFFLRFDWEMNGSWQFPWAEELNQNQPGDYVRAWQHVHDIFQQQGATNVSWVWCPNISSAKTRPLAQLYPGDNYVDWTCMDGYNFGAVSGGEWQTFAQVFSGSSFNVNHNTYAELLALAPQKPIMIGETASSELGGSKAAWIKDMLSQLPSQFPQIKALTWFNWDGGNSNETWPIASSPDAKRAFSEGIAAPAYAPNEFGSIAPMAAVAPLAGAPPAQPAPLPPPPADQPVVQPAPADVAPVADEAFAATPVGDYTAASNQSDAVDDSSDSGD